MEEIEEISPRYLRFIENSCFKSWWVVLFAIICFFGYEQGSKNIQKEYSVFYNRYQDLKIDYEEALAKQEDLKLQIQSQRDPQWIELTLMKELGLVPERQIKVFFNRNH